MLAKISMPGSYSLQGAYLGNGRSIQQTYEQSLCRFREKHSVACKLQFLPRCRAVFSYLIRIQHPRRGFTLNCGNVTRKKATAEDYHFEAHNGHGFQENVGAKGDNNIQEKAGSEMQAAEDDRGGLVPDEDYQMLVKFRSRYNLVQVLEVARRADHPLAGARLLLLDTPGNIQSVYLEYKVLTNSYYDVFATLPPLLPQGPVGILGLGAGTAARILHYFWPTVNMHGWELDPAVILVARQFFHLSELEEGNEEMLDERESAFGIVDRPRFEGYRSGRMSGASEDVQEEDGDHPHRSTVFRVTEECAAENWTRQRLGGRKSGRLVVHIGDALGSDATIEGGFAGLLVDMFAEGAVIPALQHPETWQQLKDRLRPEGRIMVNCGGSCVEAEGVSRRDGQVTMEETIAAMAKVFPGKLCIRSLGGKGKNSLALTGPHPVLQTWKGALPECLQVGISDWVLVP